MSKHKSFIMIPNGAVNPHTIDRLPVIAVLVKFAKKKSGTHRVGKRKMHLDAGEAAMSPDFIGEAIGWHGSKVRRILDKMLDDGYIDKRIDKKISVWKLGKFYLCEGKDHIIDESIGKSIDEYVGELPDEYVGELPDDNYKKQRTEETKKGRSAILSIKADSPLSQIPKKNQEGDIADKVLSIDPLSVNIANSMSADIIREQATKIYSMFPNRKFMGDRPVCIEMIAKALITEEITYEDFIKVMEQKQKDFKLTLKDDKQWFGGADKFFAGLYGNTLDDINAGRDDISYNHGSSGDEILSDIKSLDNKTVGS